MKIWTRERKMLQFAQCMLILLSDDEHDYTSGDQLIADGDKGEFTTAGLKAYQAENKLDVTGELDDKTWTKLLGAGIYSGYGTPTLKKAQCVAILDGCDDDGELVADGEFGAHTEVSFVQYVAKVAEQALVIEIDEAFLPAAE